MKEKYVHFREPTLTRKTFKKNSIISWSETGLGGLCYHKLTQIERQASGFSPRFERSGRNGLLLLNVLPQYFNRGTAA